MAVGVCVLLTGRGDHLSGYHSQSSVTPATMTMPHNRQNICFNDSLKAKKQTQGQTKTVNQICKPCSQLLPSNFILDGARTRKPTTYRELMVNYVQPTSWKWLSILNRFTPVWFTKLTENLFSWLTSQRKNSIFVHPLYNDASKMLKSCFVINITIPKCNFEDFCLISLYSHCFWCLFIHIALTCSHRKVDLMLLSCLLPRVVAMFGQDLSRTCWYVTAQLTERQVTYLGLLDLMPTAIVKQLNEAVSHEEVSANILLWEFSCQRNVELRHQKHSNDCY